MALSAGTRLGPYEILEPLGAGGMGEVYRARDPRLERDVALKVLPEGVAGDPERLRRFEKEARAAGALNHPNILAVYDVGEHDGRPYLVTELLEGDTLRERTARALPAEKAVDFAVQGARGLAAAHDKGIVHRDLKPENLFVTKDGLVKILDFGLAKLRGPQARPHGSGSEVETASRTTDPGAVIGTVGYMSPEQVRGRVVDHRSDIFSFGAVLYEMLSGQRAFRGDSGVEVLNAILKEEPPDLGPAESGHRFQLTRVLKRCLEKRPEDRFQSARDLAFHLQTLSKSVERRPLAQVDSAAPSITSLAVLPLTNFSADPDQEFFADGMTDALIGGLAQIKAVKVIARTSVTQYKEATKPLPQIARELGVEGIVEGSVMRSGDRVRIAARLIDARQERHLWANDYEREMTDVLALQSEVVHAIAGEIRAQIGPQERERVKTARTVDPKGYAAYLKGRFLLWNKATVPAAEKSIEYFRQTIEQDPRNAEAYVGLVEAYAALGQMAALPLADVAARQREAALKALEMDDNLAEGHVAVGLVMVEADWDWERAEREFRRAIELSPSHANAHLWYSQLLNYLGRHDEALAAIDRASELDPLNPFIAGNVLWRLYFLGRYDQAIAESQNILEMHPDSWLNHWTRGLLYSAKSMHDEAIAELRKAVALSEGSLECLPWLGYAYARAGATAEALAVLGKLQEVSKTTYVPSSLLVPIYVGLEETDRAFELMERAYQQHDVRLAWFSVDPSLEPLRSDPRFQHLRRRMNLPE